MFLHHIFGAHVSEPAPPAGPGSAGITLPQSPVWAVAAFPALLALRSLHSCMLKGAEGVDYRARASPLITARV